MRYNQDSDERRTPVQRDYPRLPRLPLNDLSHFPLEEDRRVVQRDAINRRKLSRALLSTPVVLRATQKHGIQGTLHNLTEDGCCVESLGLFRVGDRVWVRIEPLAAWEGTVRWIQGINIGIEFAHPLHPAVFETIAAYHQ